MRAPSTNAASTAERGRSKASLEGRAGSAVGQPCGAELGPAEPGVGKTSRVIKVSWLLGEAGGRRCRRKQSCTGKGSGCSADLRSQSKVLVIGVGQMGWWLPCSRTSHGEDMDPIGTAIPALPAWWPRMIPIPWAAKEQNHHRSHPPQNPHLPHSPCQPKSLIAWPRLAVVRKACFSH